MVRLPPSFLSLLLRRWWLLQVKRWRWMNYRPPLVPAGILLALALPLLELRKNIGAGRTLPTTSIQVSFQLVKTHIILEKNAWNLASAWAFKVWIRDTKYSRRYSRCSIDLLGNLITELLTNKFPAFFFFSKLEQKRICFLSREVWDKPVILNRYKKNRYVSFIHIENIFKDQDQF